MYETDIRHINSGVGGLMQKKFFDDLPYLLQEFCYEKNPGIDPLILGPSSGLDVWWRCTADSKHVWPAKIKSRVYNKSKCPFCSGRLVEKDKSLGALYPELASQIDFTKHKNLDPFTISPGSDKQLHWVCPNNKKHRWETRVQHRTSGFGCSQCKAEEKKLFVSEVPRLLEIWDYEKNKPNTPQTTLVSSEQLINWKCIKNSEHVWRKKPQLQRASRINCRYCSGLEASSENNLAITHPKIASEWNYQRNDDFKPEHVTEKSSMTVWWICKRFGHEWTATINKRCSRDSECPKCRAQVSKPEIRLFAELQHIFNGVLRQEKIEGQSIDIFIPAIKLCIEYDGSYWHKDKEPFDRKKNDAITQSGLKLLRLRVEPLEKLQKSDLIIPNEPELTKGTMNQVLSSIKPLCNTSLSESVSRYIDADEFQNEKSYREIVKYLPAPPPEESFENKYPLLAADWDYKKNYPLTPDLFQPNSRIVVWWKCPVAEDHEWKVSLNHRTAKQTQCPFCSGRLADSTNNLQITHPNLAAEWHPTKNGNLKPTDFKAGASKKVWWKCPVAEDHEWPAKIQNRANGRKCPFCGGKTASSTNNLQDFFPAVSADWDYKKNHPLTPRDVVKNSSKKVYWRCSVHPQESWKTKVSYRTRDNQKYGGCKLCKMLKDS